MKNPYKEAINQVLKWVVQYKTFFMRNWHWNKMESGRIFIPHRTKRY
jgi:hypothetical protein